MHSIVRVGGLRIPYRLKKQAWLPPAACQTLSWGRGNCESGGIAPIHKRKTGADQRPFPVVARLDLILFMEIPPSTSKALPTVKVEASDARYSTTCTISSGAETGFIR